jgi:hypothetical protein
MGADQAIEQSQEIGRQLARSIGFSEYPDFF